MTRLAHFAHWCGHPFRCCARGLMVLINLSREQMRALFSVAMIGGIIALSTQNMVMIIIEWLGVDHTPVGSLLGRMMLNQQWWNNAIMAGFAMILGLVVFGADYFRAKVDQKELEFGSKRKGGEQC